MATHHKEYKSRVILGEYQTPKMVVWILKHSGGLLKTQRQAAYLLFGFVLFTLVAVPYLTLNISGIMQHPSIYAPAPGMMPGRGTDINTSRP